MIPLAERLAAKVDISGDHHLWLGASGSDGTPQIRVGGSLTTVRRVVWELAHGPLAPTATVAACLGQPGCVRLEHLGLGRARRSPVREPSPRRRSRRGSGSMRQVDNGAWELAVTTAGRRRYRTVRGTRSEAAVALERFAADIHHSQGTLQTLVATYFDHLDDRGRSPATVYRYRQLWRDWLAPTLARTPADALTRRQLEHSLAAMAKAGQSRSSIHQAAVVLSGCLTWARHHGQIEGNPARGLNLPDGTTLGAPRRR